MRGRYRGPTARSWLLSREVESRRGMAKPNIRLGKTTPCRPRSSHGRLEEALVPGNRADVGAPQLRQHASAGRALQETELEQVRLVDVLDRVGLLAEGHSEGREPNRPPVEAFHDRAQELAVDPLKALSVDLEQLERLGRDLSRHCPLMPHLGDIPYAAKDAVRDPRGAARAAGDLLGRVIGDLHVENASRAPHDQSELGRVVVVEPEGHPEAVAQRRCQQAGSRRRPDEREVWKIERERACGRPLPHDDVEPKVLERRIEDLLDRPVDPVDLVDEQHVALLESGEDRGHVTLALERGAGNRANADSELLAEDEGEARLSEPGRPDEKNVVERFAARSRSLERDAQLLLDALLSDEVVEPRRSQGAFELVLGAI